MFAGSDEVDVIVHIFLIPQKFIDVVMSASDGTILVSNDGFCDIVADFPIADVHDCLRLSGKAYHRRHHISGSHL